MNVYADQMQQLLQGNNQAIVDTIVTMVHVAVPIIQNTQGARVGDRGGPEGNGSDPFTKSSKAFSVIRVLKFSGDEGPMLDFKRIVYPQCMVYMLDYVPTERVRRELLNHQMIGSGLTCGKVLRLV